MTTKKPAKPPKVIVPEAPTSSAEDALKHGAIKPSAAGRVELAKMFVERGSVTPSDFVEICETGRVPAHLAPFCLACGNPKDGVCAACGN